MSPLVVLLLAAGATGPAVRAQPERLRLGDATQLRLLVELPGEGPLAAVCSEGTLTDLPEGFLVKVGGSRAPRWLHAAVWRDEPGAQPIFASIPLWGRATIPVRTDPGASVTALVAGERYGPFLADAAGLAAVVVDVPPGVTSGTTTAVAPFGTPVTRPLPLDVPQAAHLHGVLVAEEPAADGTLRARLVLAWLGGGAAPPASQLRAATSAGTLGPIEAGAGGRYEAVLSLPTALAGPVQVRLSVARDPASALLVRGTLERVLAVRLDLKARPVELVGGGSTELTIRLVDSRGRGIPVAAPRLEADGVAVPVSKAGRGTWRALLSTAPVATPRELLLRATLSEPGLSVRLPVRLLPVPPVALLLTPEQGTVEADGVSGQQLSLTVQGAQGPVLSAVPVVKASAGTLRLSGVGPGSYTLRFTPPLLERPATARLASIRAELGPLVAESRVELVPVQRRARAFLRAGVGAGGAGPDETGLPLSVRLGGGVPVRTFGALALLLQLEAAVGRGSPANGGATATELAALVACRSGLGRLELEAAAGVAVLDVESSTPGGSALAPALAGRLVGAWPLGPGAIELTPGLTLPLGSTPEAKAAVGGVAGHLLAGYRLDL